MSDSLMSVRQLARRCTELPWWILNVTPGLRGAPRAGSGTCGLAAALLLGAAALLALSPTASAQTAVGAKFSIASGWAGAGAAFDGTNFLVGLQGDTSTAKVAAQLVSPAGTKIGSTIALGHDGQSCCAAGLAFDGTNYLLAWEEDQGIKNSWAPLMVYGRFINTSGGQVGQAFAMTTAGISFDGINMLAYGGGKYLLTYTRLIVPTSGDGANNRYVAGRIVSPDGTLGGEFRIGTAYGNGSSVAFDGTNFFVVWKEDSQDYEVRGRFVSPSGALGQELSINASPAYSDNPIVLAYDGTNYLVVWTDDAGAGGDIYAQRVSPSGGLVGGPITIASESGMQMAMGVGFDGANHLVTWVDMKNDANRNGICDSGEGTCADVYGQYVGKDGVLVGGKIAINTDAGNQIGGVGCAGGKCLALVSSGIVFGQGGLAQVGEAYGAFLTAQAPTTTTSTTTPTTTTTTTSSTTSTTLTLNERVWAGHDFDIEGGWHAYELGVMVPIPQAGVSPINGFTLSGPGIATPVQAVNEGFQWHAKAFFGSNPPAMPATYTANFTVADGTVQTRTYTVQKWSSAFPTSITPAANSVITGPMPVITWTNAAASGLLYGTSVWNVPSSGPYVQMWRAGGYTAAPILYNGPTLPAGNYKIFLSSNEIVGVVTHAAQIRVPIQCGGAGCTATTTPVSARAKLGAGNSHSLALKSDGTVVAWGDNTYGQSTVPAGLANAVAVAAGGVHSLAAKSDGTVVAWGRNDYGQTTVPAGLANVVAVAAGGWHSLALKSDGTVAAWGINFSGESTVPAGLANVVAVAAGGQHSLALKSDGSVVTWGVNDYGQRPVPAGLGNVVAVAGGSRHSLAVKSDGTVVAWGWDNNGQSTVPAGLSNVVAVAAGVYHSLALKSDGTVVAWGSNGYGQTTVPTGLSNVVAIAAGAYFNLALKSDGTVVAWGTGQGTVPAGLNLGAASAPAIGLNPTSLGFAAQTVGTTSAAQTVTLTNTGSALLNISSIVASGDYARSTTCGATLAAAANCTISVTFTPTAAGTRSGSLSIATNAAGSPHTVSLNGTGVAAGDTEAPAVPTGLTATAASSTQINLSWTASTDNVGVVQYVIYRGGTLLTGLSGSIPPPTSYSDSGLTASTSYSYTVAACDAAGNCSAQSAAATTSTQAPAALSLLSNDSALTNPYSLETDGTTLYIANGNKVLSMPIGGGAVSTLFANATSYSVMALTRIGTNLYWIDPQGDLPSTSTAIWRGATSGGAVTNIYLGSATGEPIADGSGLTTDGTVLFAADMVQGRVVSMNADGSGITTLGSRYGGYFDTEHLNTVVESGGILYIADWGRTGTNEPQVISIPKAGGSFTALHVGAPFVSPASIAVGNGMVYVADPGANNTIWKLPIAGGTPTALISGAPFMEIGRLLFYNNALYISDTGNTGASDGPGAIYRLDLGGAPTAPVAYWTFDNDTANDTVGTHHGTIVGSGVTFTTGKVGRAISFSESVAQFVGGSSYVKIPSFNLPYLTLSAWVNSTKSGYYTSMVTKNYYASGWSPPYTTWQLWFSENTAQPGTNSTGTESQTRWNIASPDAVPMNEWFHLAATYDGYTARLYVNGVEKASAAVASPGPLPETQGNIYIGSPEFSNHSFTGLIDEVAIWDHALSATEIAQQYQNGLSGRGYLAVDNVAPSTPTAYSQHWSPPYWSVYPDSYSVRVQYRDSPKTATAVSVTGIGYAVSEALTYNAGQGSWNNTRLSVWPTYPSGLPYTYTFSITDAVGTRTATSTVSCFQQQFATNLSPAGAIAGTPVFSWTGIADSGAIYGVQLNDSNGNWVWSNYNISGTSIAYNGPALTVGANYRYDVLVRSSSACSNGESYSQGSFTYGSSGADTQAPTVPTGLAAVPASATQINITWTASTDNVGVTGYKVYRSGLLVGSPAETPFTAGTGYSDKGLTAATSYSYTVAACDAAGNCSAQSAAVAATTASQDTQAPTVPTGLTATATSGSQINLAWTASTDDVGVTQYKVFRGGSLIATLGAVTSYGDSGLAAGTAYTYAVAACDAAGNCSAQSASAAATTLSSTTSLNLDVGWNLVGNGSSGSIDVASAFGDAAKVTTAWKWIANSAKWAFYAPSLVGQALSDYAASKGYDVLSTINGGEGFWINAKSAFAATLPAGAAINSASFQGMASGWNLIAVGDNKTPRAFNSAIGVTPPAAGEIPLNVITLWAWDAPLASWYFYAPSLDKSGGLAGYIASKNYLDFGNKVLEPTTGFWVNKP